MHVCVCAPTPNSGPEQSLWEESLSPLLQLQEHWLQLTVSFLGHHLSDTFCSAPGTFPLSTIWKTEVKFTEREIYH